LKGSGRITLILLGIIALTLMLAACGAPDTSEDEADSDVTYGDGIYTGESEKREFGYESAEVTIEDGQIADIVLRRMTPEGEEVDYDEWDGQGDKPNLKQFKDDLAKEMVSNQTYDVDSISTATETSEGWKAAVKEALDKAK